VGYEVDVAKLRDVAGKVDASAGAVAEVFRAARGNLGLPATGGSGWSTTAAAGPTASAREAFGPRLQAMVTALAADLRSSADEYAAADDSAAYLFGGRRFECELTLPQLLAADPAVFTAAGARWRKLANGLDDAAEDLIRGTRDLVDAWHSDAASQAAVIQRRRSGPR
jgi:uncharacterized protein YukE